MCRCTIHLLRNLWIIRINLIINHSHAKSNDSSFNDKRPCRIDEIIAKTGLGQYIFIRIINSFIIIFLTKLVLRVHSTKHQLWFFVFKIGVMIERLKFSRNFGQELEVPIRTQEQLKCKLYRLVRPFPVNCSNFMGDSLNDICFCHLLNFPLFSYLG